MPASTAQRKRGDVVVKIQKRLAKRLKRTTRNRWTERMENLDQPGGT